MESIDAKWWLDLAQWLLTAALALWIHLSNRHNVTREKIHELAEGLDERLDNHESRLIRAEKDIEALPNTKEFRVLQSDIKALEGDIKALSVNVNGLRDALQPISQNLDRINTYLLRAKS